MAIDVEEFEFESRAIDKVVASLDLLISQRDGWANLLPGLDLDDADEFTSQSGIFSIFGSRQPSSTMCTFVPPKMKGKSKEGVTLGILHPGPRLVVKRLKEKGLDLPKDWQVRQDQAKRGLVLWIPLSSSTESMVEWAIRAGTMLCAEATTGTWKARIYHPVRSRA